MRMFQSGYKHIESMTGLEDKNITNWLHIRETACLLCIFFRKWRFVIIEGLLYDIFITIPDSKNFQI